MKTASLFATGEKYNFEGKLKTEGAIKLNKR
jgi:hypothetical protein